MGYACPVCDSTQADAEHLANHLAITASLGRENHREWLAEYAPDWADCGPEELGEVVSEYALEVETEGSTGEHDHAPAGRPDVEVETALARQSRGAGRSGGRESLTEETERALAEARELTERRREGANERSKSEEGGESGDGKGTKGAEGKG
ncbi:DUF5810 domain-containing protein [Saliphagus sp. LR7]|uniref:DUF5810 domain-containing protein n=1 Tax=Saliphagus sp. LR7 TaxID=2282654 RepID=UPI000DF74908|nr:DUF5810 domain-containing protein [Saliphagus sp. LR7]